MAEYERISNVRQLGIHCGIPLSNIRSAMGSQAVQIDWEKHSWLCSPNTLLELLTQSTVNTKYQFISMVRKCGILIKRIQ